MIWLLIGLGIYLAIGIFILIVFIKMKLSGFTFWNVLGTIFAWLPIWIITRIKHR